MAAKVPAHPGASTPEISIRMRSFPRRDTLPELALRRLLHSSGYRYRLHYPVPGRRRRTIDIAFTRYRIAIFLDGCFWHGCPEHGDLPAANREWWKHKIQVTKARDADTADSLQAAGWIVLRFWEHEATEYMAARVGGALAGAKHEMNHAFAVSVSEKISLGGHKGSSTCATKSDFPN